jgi:predicted transcriptional regulator
MNIGERKQREADQNRARVNEYFHANPFDRQSECAAALNLSPETISRHVKALRAGLAKAKRRSKRTRK